MKEKTCFIIMSFDQKYDSVYELAIKRAVQDSGFKSIRIDERSIPGNIPIRIIQGIIDSDLVIADISEPSPNVFYELGVSHSIGNKTVTISQDLNNLPFDVRNEFTLAYKDTKEGLRLLYFELKEVIKRLVEHPNEPANIVQLAGRDFFDFKNKIRKNLRNLTEEGQRISEFRKFLVNKKTDNSKVIKDLSKFIKGKSKPEKVFFVAISGAAGLGKTTLAKELKLELIKNDSAIKVGIVQSDAYMLNRAERIEKNLSGYDPKANNISLLKDNLLAMKEGKAIFYKPYNHATGEHDNEIEIKSSDIVILDGIHTFHPLIIPLIHVKLFIYASPSDTKELRFLADIFERNYTVHTAFQHAEQEYENFGEHILHYVKFADKVVQLDNYWKLHL